MVKRVFGSRAAESRGPSYTATPVLQVSEDIIPIAELKARLSDVVRTLEGRRPLIVTLNGKPAAVLMSAKEFDRIAYRQRVIESINEGLRDDEQGRTYTHSQVGEMIEARFGVGATKKKR